MKKAMRLIPSGKPDARSLPCTVEKSVWGVLEATTHSLGGGSG